MTIDTTTATESQPSAGQAWEQIKSKRAKLQKLADTPGSDPSANALWSQVDQYERAIHASEESGVHAIEAKLWCALTHLLTDRSDEALALNGDLAALNERDSALDWPERLILSALRSVRGLAH